MEKIFIGVDGGGTKTALLVAHADGTEIGAMQTSGASWREHGVRPVAEMIAGAIASLSESPIGGLVAGLPCFSESVEGDAALQEAFEDIFPGVPFCLTNDVEVGWAGSFGLKPGVHLVAGTGSIAYGCDGRGNRVRCGGWDEFFSDEGSAYWIAQKGMQLFSKQSDGRAPVGPLLMLVREAYKLSRDIDFIDCLYAQMDTREKRARFQLLLEKAARLGDTAAAAIYADAAAELCLMARTVREKLGLDTEGWRVSYSGGVFKAGDLILEPLAKQIRDEGGLLIAPEHLPVKGALLLALDRFVQ